MTIIYLWSHQLPLRGFVFFLQARLRPRSRATAPRYHGGAAWRRPSSESVCCCCTGCCCITAASQRAAGRCCTCTTRWSLLSETRWGRSPSWARAKVLKHILTHTHTHTVFCEVKCFKKSNCSSATAASGKLLFRSEETEYLQSEVCRFSFQPNSAWKLFLFIKLKPELLLLTWTQQLASLALLNC